MVCIQDTGHRLVWYLHSSGISKATIGEMEYLMFLFVEHQATLNFFVGFARRCSRWHNRMPRQVPSPSLPTCVADTFHQVESDVVQTYLGEDESHRRLFRMEPTQV
eukprot:2734269-Pyramimonas_sp.AAC.1